MKSFLKRGGVIVILAILYFVPFQADAAMVGQGSYTIDYSGLPNPWNVATSDNIILNFYDGLVASGETYTKVDSLDITADNGSASIAITPLSNSEIFNTLTNGKNDQITHLFRNSSGDGGGSGLTENTFFSGVTSNGIDFHGYTLDSVTFSFVGDLTAQTVVATVTAYGTNPVPVPSALLLLGSGLLGIAGVNRRRK